MKFDLSDFVQLDTNGLLNVNGGGSCSGSSSSSSSDSSSSSNSGSDGNGGGGSNPGSGTTRVYVPTGPYNGYYAEKTSKGSKNSTKNGGSSSSGGGGGGGSCNGASDGKTVYHNPYYGGNNKSDDNSNNSNGHGSSSSGSTPSGGGTCSTGTTPKTNGGTTTTIPSSGNFGQITDGSYADKLTMQYYLKHFPWTNGEIIDSFMYGTYVDHNGVEQQCKFSTVGCKEIGSAKIGSELLGENVSPMSIQNNCDLDKDGNLSANEIAQGLNNMLDEKFGDIFDIEYEEINSNINLEKLEEIANENDTYVLGFAQNCHGGHWVVLEGYSQDSSGNITFNYDGTSDNDMANNRSFVLGIQNQSVSSEKYAITRIQTFTKVSK